MKPQHRPAGGVDPACVYDLPAARTDDGIGLAWRDVTVATDSDSDSDSDTDRQAAAIIETSDDAIIAKTLDGVILQWNLGAERLYGYAAGEVIGTDLSMLEPPDRQGEVRALLARIKAGEHIAHHETVRVRKDGQRVDVSLSVSPVLDAEGHVTSACTIARDVTERRQNEQAREGYNRGLIEASQDGLVTVGSDLVITDVNRSMCAILGRPRAELIGSCIPDYFASPQRAAESIRTALRQGKVGDDLALRAAGGRERLVSLSATTYADADGDLQGVFVTARDVTERRQAEDDLARMTDLLNRSQEISHTGGWEYDVATGRLVWTEETYRIYGIDKPYPPADVGAAIAAFDAPGAQVVDAAFQRLVTEGQPYDLELELVRADGSRIWVRTIGRPVYVDGRIVSVGGNIVDITDRRLAQEQALHLTTALESRVQDLERANRELESFGYSVSHDLRSPLRALSGFAEVLLEEYGSVLDETGRRYAQRICAASQRMASLIDDLLHLSRVSRAQPRIETVDLSEMIRAIVADLRAKDPTRDVTVAVADDVLARADRTLIQTVLANLLDNAWKFTATQTRAHIEFGVRPDPPPGEVSCYVQDDGAGFDAAYTDKLFQPFQRLHTLTEFPGTGVGLASVRRIVELHGGQTWADGEVDRGATISFTLPAEENGDG